MKTIGYIVSGPAEFLIHQRFGKIRRQGREIGFFCLPVIDSYYRIPSSTHSLVFQADQITAENQGVEVSGFAIWKICEPALASRNFDFSDSAQAIGAISASLKDVVESAIRHQVANMSIEEVLRKRGSIILQLKQELAYIADQWGLQIETIEIKNVNIMSEQLFSNMQAKFRDAVRLESETSALEADRAVAERRFAQREQLALREQEFNRRDMERKAELEARRAESQKDLKAQSLALALEIKEIEHSQREREFALEQALSATERETQKERFALEMEREQHAAALATLRNESELTKITTTNQRDPILAAINALPSALAGLNLQSLQVGSDTLQRIADGLSALTTRQNS